MDPREAHEYSMSGSGEDATSFERPGRQARVEIPRLHSVSSSATPPRARVGQACLSCRQQKLRCSGERPSCARCVNMTLTCVYSVGRRKDQAQQYEKLRVHNVQLRDLLKDLQPEVNSRQRDRIQNCLDLTSTEDVAGSEEHNTLQRQDVEQGKSSARTSKISTGDVLESSSVHEGEGKLHDYSEEGPDAQWLQSRERHQLAKIKDLLRKLGADPRLLGDVQASFTKSPSGIFLDDPKIVDNESSRLDEMPDPNVAHALFVDFMESTNGEFPVLHVEASVAGMIQAVLDTRSAGNKRAELRTLAIINMTYAIGASYAHLTGDAQGDEEDHYRYFSRARQLTYLSDAFDAHIDVQSVQLAVLMGTYYLCSSQLSRAWIVTGVAVRAAGSIGLHIRAIKEDGPPHTSSPNVRIFWAVWLLERQLCRLTGRPTSLDNKYCSLAVPSIQDLARHGDPDNLEYVSNTVLNLSINLAKIGQSSLDALYTAFSSQKSWPSILTDIERLAAELSSWRQQVPQEFDFDSLDNVRRKWVHVARNLGFQYHITRILAYRKCLEPAQANVYKQHKAAISKHAENCVHAAEAIADMLPESYDPVELYRNGPWYIQVIIITQCVLILVVEMSHSSIHTRDQGKLVLRLKHTIRWLREMARHSAVAIRAWEYCTGLFAEVAPRIGEDTSDINMDEPEETEVVGRHHSMFPFRLPFVVRCDGWLSHSRTGSYAEPAGDKSRSTARQLDLEHIHEDLSSVFIFLDLEPESSV